MIKINKLREKLRKNREAADAVTQPEVEESKPKPKASSSTPKQATKPATVKPKPLSKFKPIIEEPEEHDDIDEGWSDDDEDDGYAKKQHTENEEKDYGDGDYEDSNIDEPDEESDEDEEPDEEPDEEWARHDRDEAREIARRLKDLDSESSMVRMRAVKGTTNKQVLDKAITVMDVSDRIGWQTIFPALTKENFDTAFNKVIDFNRTWIADIGDNPLCTEAYKARLIDRCDDIDEFYDELVAKQWPLSPKLASALVEKSTDVNIAIATKADGLMTSLYSFMRANQAANAREAFDGVVTHIGTWAVGKSPVEILHGATLFEVAVKYMRSHGFHKDYVENSRRSASVTTMFDRLKVKS